MSHYTCLISCYEGGYDLLGRTKDQIRTTEQVNAAFNACTALKLDALVIIGGILIFVFKVHDRLHIWFLGF